jgi:dihydrofolate synthase/folylpolyglutamate synthase
MMRSRLCWSEVLDALPRASRASFFEVTTAAAFLAFSADPGRCLRDRGRAGRPARCDQCHRRIPAVCGIAQLGLDHQSFLGDTDRGDRRRESRHRQAGAPLVTLHYPARVANRIGQAAQAAGAAWLQRGAEWQASAIRGRLHYQDGAGTLDLPLPRLPGAHQAINAGLAIAMLRHQQALAVPPAALKAAMGWAEWPARLQRLTNGALPALLGAEAELWLDGGHNPAAARAIAQYFRRHLAPGAGFDIILGMLANKDLAGFLEPFAGSGVRLRAFPVPGHEHHAPEDIVATAEALGLVGSVITDPIAGLSEVAAEGGEPPVVMIGGTLYIAGSVLSANGTPPT